MKKKKESPIRLGKEEYGDMNIHEAFKKAFEPYFNKEKKQLPAS